MTRIVTLQLPEQLYIRPQQTAQATQQSLDEILLHAVEVGSPPAWETAPAEFQADLSALDRLSTRQTEADMRRYQELLDKNANGLISSAERSELTRLRTEFDRHMLRKVHAAALLQWRGQQVPPADKL